MYYTVTMTLKLELRIESIIRHLMKTTFRVKLCDIYTEYFNLFFRLFIFRVCFVFILINIFIKSLKSVILARKCRMNL